MSTDKEKKKYFKIQTSSAAPASSAYSSQDVKRRKTRCERAEARALSIARQRGRMKRSKIMAEPLAGGLLTRENGQHGLDTAQILAGGLVPQGYISSMLQFSSCSDPLFAFGHRPDLGPSISDLWIGKSLSFDASNHLRNLQLTYLPYLSVRTCSSFLSLSCPFVEKIFFFFCVFTDANLSAVYDDQLLTLRVNSDKGARSASHGCVEICHDFSIPAINNAIWRIERFGRSGASTSISTNEASKRLALTWLAPSAQAGIAVTAMAGIGELGSV
jgi:hypothetical protein